MVFKLKLGNAKCDRMSVAHALQPGIVNSKTRGLQVVRAAQRIEDSFTFATLRFPRVSGSSGELEVPLSGLSSDAKATIQALEDQQFFWPPEREARQKIFGLLR